jgi:hypothetical protein
MRFYFIAVSAHHWNRTRNGGLRYSEMQRVLARLNGVPLWFQRRLGEADA